MYLQGGFDESATRSANTCVRKWTQTKVKFHVHFKGCSFLKQSLNICSYGIYMAQLIYSSISLNSGIMVNKQADIYVHVHMHALLFQIKKSKGI